MRVHKRCERAGSVSRPAATRTLPSELQEAAVERLGLLALLVAIFSMVLRLAMPPGPGATPLVRAVGDGAVVLTVLISLAMAALAWWRAMPAKSLLDLALLYEIVQAFLFSVSFHSVALAPNAVPRGWSTVAVWIMVFPLIVATTRGKTVGATVLSALMEPLGMAIAVAAGSPVPSGSVAAGIFLRTGLAVVASLLVSRVVYRLSADAAEARELGSYQLLERIGEGGMGEVWRAEHRLLARPAAIKLIRQNGNGSRDAISRFEREAKATAALRSPHTVEVYDSGTSEDGTFYYVMELLDGYDADTLVKRFGPVPPERAVHLLRQVCHSLEEAHRAGMVHRDIKPANIFVCRYGLELDFVKVVDFGLVRVSNSSAADADRLTSERVIAGTPAYISPEMALGDSDVDWRADIYSLGCVGYWLLTGKQVFDNPGNPGRLLLEHIKTPPVAPSRQSPAPIPKELDDLILSCLAKDPENRPQTAQELADRLASLGLEQAWTPRRREIWWLDHSPGLAGAAESTGAPLVRKIA